jgi:anion-transporting  ArsA/GET3 family ATPase
MNQGFRERAVRVRELFGRPETTFVIVASPARDAIDEALFFRRRLDESGLAFGAAVVNRVSPALPDPTPLVEAEIRGLVGEGLGRRVSRNLAEGRALHARDRESVARLASEVGEAPLVLVPQLAGDVHDLRGLTEMGAHLMTPAEPLGAAAPEAAQTGAE